jgi:hypothetical protein
MIVKLYNLKDNRIQAKVVLTDGFIKDNGLNIEKSIFTVELNNMRFLVNASFVKRIGAKKQESIEGFITIPKKYVDEMKIKDGQDIDIKIISGCKNVKK